MEIVSSEQTELTKSLDGCVASGSRHNRRLSSSTGRRLRVPPFLNKVYEFVDDPNTDAIISWSSGGTRFTVWDHHVFSKQILPRYFRHDVFSSFVYQLNNYVSVNFWTEVVFYLFLYIIISEFSSVLVCILNNFAYVVYWI